MSLQYEVDSLDGVDEGMQSLYAEKEGGGYKLAVEGIDDGAELKEALRKEREDRKAASGRAKELEDQMSKAQREQQEKNQEFQSLYENEQKEKKALEEKYSTFEQRIQSKDIDAAALKVGSQLTRDTKRAELLQKEIRSFTKYGEDGVYFEIGGIKVDQNKVVDHLTKEYPFLVDGNQASGGGAGGSGSGATGSKTVTRAEFESMDNGARMTFTKDGGKVVEN